MELKGRVVVITGSGQGLGRAFARRLLQDGAKVCLSDIQEETGLATMAELQDTYGQENVHFVRCDVTKLDELTALYDQAEAHFQDKVDIWCNNAGINHTAGWRKCMEIDIMAVMAGTYLAMDKMSKAKGGRGGLIVNTASGAGIIFGNKDKDLADANCYFVAKHGVVALTRALSNPEVEAETGVRVVCICPSFADTNIIKEGMMAGGQIAREKIDKAYGLMTPEYVAEGFHSLITSCGNGSALMVAKSPWLGDVPFFTFPDLSLPIILLLATGAKLSGLRVFQWHHQLIFLLFLLVITNYLLNFILSLFF